MADEGPGDGVRDARGLAADLREALLEDAAVPPPRVEVVLQGIEAAAEEGAGAGHGAEGPAVPVEAPELAGVVEGRRGEDGVCAAGLGAEKGGHGEAVLGPRREGLWG